MVEGQSRRVRRLPMAFGPSFETLARSYPDGTSETSKNPELDLVCWPGICFASSPSLGDGSRMRTCSPDCLKMTATAKLKQ